MAITKIRTLTVRGSQSRTAMVEQRRQFGSCIQLRSRRTSWLNEIDAA